MSHIADFQNSPWPGPRPYEIEEGDIFFGRGRDVSEVMRKIQNERLSILTGPSATGKTSLLRAGVVRALFHKRNQSGEKNATLRIPPTLLLRDWALASREVEFIDDLLLERFKVAVNELAKWLPSDYQILADIPAQDNILEYISGLCDKSSGLYLVFDQFEEVIRIGYPAANRILSIIEQLYRFEPRVHILISLREEYHKDLRELEKFAGGLFKRTYFLLPMEVETVRAAVISATETHKISIAEDVVDVILSDWSDSMTILGEADPVNLLAVQAVLHELHEFCQNVDSPVITTDLFHQYKDNLDAETISVLWQGALERWIETAIDPIDPHYIQSFGFVEDVPEPILTGVSRRIAARMAQFLSSGGYKVSAEEIDLRYGVLRQDFSRLRPDIDKVPREAWKIIHSRPTRLNRDALGLKYPNKNEDNNYLSGLARRKSWSAADTADKLAGIFNETLERLKSRNIVKNLRKGDDILWELVHDGLGRPFARWAERQRETWRESICSFTASRGIDIVVSPGDITENLVCHMTWLGCRIVPHGNVILDEVSFQDCDLKGTIFENCVFHGGGFIRCDLNGVLFMNCQFIPDSNGRQVVFEQCNPSSMAFINLPIGITPKIQGLQFNKCKLIQLTISNINIDQPVKFIDCELLLCRFALNPTTRKTDSLLSFINCTVDYCAWDGDIDSLIERGAGTKINSSGIFRQST